MIQKLTYSIVNMSYQPLWNTTQLGAHQMTPDIQQQCYTCSTNYISNLPYDYASFPELHYQLDMSNIADITLEAPPIEQELLDQTSLIGCHQESFIGSSEEVHELKKAVVKLQDSVGVLEARIVELQDEYVSLRKQK